MSATTTPTAAPTLLNGLDPQAIQELIDQITAEPAKGQTHWNVVSKWQGGARSRATVKSVRIGGDEIERPWVIQADEPFEIGGTNTQPNPQELLLSALNACMTVGYAALATLMGITLESLEIETKGDIDLRGFLGIDPDTKPGYDNLHYTVRIKSNGTDEQIQQIHEIVQQTSPNYFNISRPVRMEAELVCA